MWVIPQCSLSEARQQNIYTPAPNSPRLSVPPGELNSQAPKAFLQIGKVDSSSPRAEVPQSDQGLAIAVKAQGNWCHIVDMHGLSAASDLK